jgi:hypothetical protein
MDLGSQKYLSGAHNYVLRNLAKYYFIVQEQTSYSWKWVLDEACSKVRYDGNLPHS